MVVADGAFRKHFSSAFACRSDSRDACALAGPVVVYVLLLIGLPDYAIADSLMKFCRIYIIAMFIRLACSIISSVYVMSSEHDRLKNHSMKGFYQMLKLAVICVGTIVIVSILVDKNPTVLLTGLGAGTAILMLVFQDTIKGFVAGIQLIANDMLRPDDWITMPKYVQTDNAAFEESAQ